VVLEQRAIPFDDCAADAYRHHVNALRQSHGDGHGYTLRASAFREQCA
jgi:hypothetical protein